MVRDEGGCERGEEDDRDSEMAEVVRREEEEDVVPFIDFNAT